MSLACASTLTSAQTTHDRRAFCSDLIREGLWAVLAWSEIVSDDGTADALCASDVRDLDGSRSRAAGKCQLGSSGHNSVFCWTFRCTMLCSLEDHNKYCNTGPGKYILSLTISSRSDSRRHDIQRPTWMNGIHVAKDALPLSRRRPTAPCSARAASR